MSYTVERNGDWIGLYKNGLLVRESTSMSEAAMQRLVGAEPKAPNDVKPPWNPGPIR